MTKLYTSNTKREILIDPKDYEALSAFRWCETSTGGKG